MKKCLLALCILPCSLVWAEPSTTTVTMSSMAPAAVTSSSPTVPAVTSEAPLLKQAKLLNQIPQDQLNEKADPALSILRTIDDQDGPDFSKLRRLLGQAEVRKELNPSVKTILAGLLSQRWDTFALCGNLYLAGVSSPNTTLREMAGKRLVYYIQPAHILPLINLLKVPGPNVLAYGLLQEVTGEHLDPSIKTWQAWWAKGGSKTDLVGHMIDDTRVQLANQTVHDFDQERFWYLPEGVTDAETRYNSRPADEQAKINDWTSWVNTDVKRYVSDWAAAKPILDRIVHQPDNRVNQYLEGLVSDPGLGDYASVVLAWRGSTGSANAIDAAYQTKPTVGRALARGSLGDRTALTDLLGIMERHQNQPLSYKIMDDDARAMLPTLRTVGVVPAEHAFQLLTHQHFDFDTALTSKDKKKAFKKAKSWLKANFQTIKLPLESLAH